MACIRYFFLPRVALTSLFTSTTIMAFGVGNKHVIKLLLQWHKQIAKDDTYQGWTLGGLKET